MKWKYSNVLLHQILINLENFEFFRPNLPQKRLLHVGLRFCVFSVWCIWLYVLMSCMHFRVNPHSVVGLNVKELLTQSRCLIFICLISWIKDDWLIALWLELVLPHKKISEVLPWISCQLVIISVLQLFFSIKLFNLH